MRVVVAIFLCIAGFALLQLAADTRSMLQERDFLSISGLVLGALLFYGAGLTAGRIK